MTAYIHPSSILKTVSKAKLKKYLKGLSKKELEGQMVDLYERLPQVKTFYDFVFNPKEDALVRTCKEKIHKEYFPNTRRRAKARRSVAQKHIKHFQTLGMDPGLIADVMLYNLETAQAFSAERMPNQKPFFVSMHKSFKEAVGHCAAEGLLGENRHRLERIAQNAVGQQWENAERFVLTLAELPR